MAGGTGSTRQREESADTTDRSWPPSGATAYGVTSATTAPVSGSTNSTRSLMIAY